MSGEQQDQLRGGIELINLVNQLTDLLNLMKAQMPTIPREYCVIFPSEGGTRRTFCKAASAEEAIGKCAEYWGVDASILRAEVVE